MADDLNENSIGASHELRLYDSGDVLLATMTYAASNGVVSTVSGAEAITYSEASYTDDETPGNAGTVSYATIQRTAATAREVVRFTDPTTELSLSSTTIATDEPVRVTTDVVVKLPTST
jgi:hypothetical protein